MADLPNAPPTYNEAGLLCRCQGDWFCRAGELAQRIEALETVLNTTTKRAATYQAALQRIRDDYGLVCAEYELCTHVACESSYGAWATADEALRPSADLPP
jgi:hypothetical protein